MQFKLSALAAVLSVVSYAQAQLSATDVVRNINQVTGLSADTQLIAAGINHQTVVDKAPKTIHHFREIVDLVAKDISAMQGTRDPPAMEGQARICEAFRNFVVVHQKLLETVIGKHGLLSRTEWTYQLAQVLRAVEGGVDTLAFGLINLVPGCSRDAHGDKMKLDDTLIRAIRVYS